jgi:hypothetical protein
VDVAIECAFGLAALAALAAIASAIAIGRRGDWDECVLPRAHSVRAYELGLLLPATLWLPAGCLLFILSAVGAPPTKVPPFAEGLRALLFFGWMASAFLGAVAMAEI